MEDRENITEVLPDGESQDTPPQPKPGDVPSKIPFQKILLIVLVVVMVIIFILPNFLFVDKWRMKNAKDTLRALGQAELAYQGTNNNKDYATYERLLIEGYIPSKADQDDLIPYYEMTLSVLNSSQVHGGSGTSGLGSNCFTIIAFPDRPRRLDTFCITEDQRLRVYSPGHGNKYDAIYHWDPVL